MSTKQTKTPIDETVMEAANPVPEEVVQPDLPTEEAAQKEQTLQVQAEQAAQPEPEEAPLCTGRVCQVEFCSSLNLREAPGMASAVVRVLPAGTELLIDPLEWVADGTGVWFPATVDGVDGFVSGQYLAPVGV